LYKSFTMSQAAVAGPAQAGPAQAGLAQAGRGSAAAATVARRVATAPLLGEQVQREPGSATVWFTSDAGSAALLAVVVVLGIGLRVAQYLSHQSLWGDEAYLILNVRGSSFGGLLGRLDLAAMPQNCPPLLLLVLKLLDRRPAMAEWLLRLPPLVASCAALIFFALAARKILLTWRFSSIAATGWACFAALAMALSDRMIFQAATVKQYSSDVFCSSVMMYAWVSWRQSRRRTSWGHERRAWLKFSLLGAALVWVSLPVPMVYLPLALAMLVEQKDDATGRRWRIVRWLACQLPFAVSLALLAGTCLRNQTDPQMWRLWAPALANWHNPLAIPLWLVNRSLQLFAYPLGPLSNLLPLGLLGAGVMAWRRNWTMLLGLTGPIGVLMIAALARLHPLTGQRVTMFVAPFELMLATVALVAMAQFSWWARPLWWRRAAVALAIYLLAAPTVLAVRHLARQQSKGNLRQMIQIVAARRLPGERVYGGDSEADAVIRCYESVSGVDSAGVLRSGVLLSPALDSRRSFWLIVARDPSRPGGRITPLPIPRGWSIGNASVKTNDGEALHLALTQPPPLSIP
jgi:hypothetical protein